MSALQQRFEWWLRHRRTRAFPPLQLTWPPAVAQLVRRTWLRPPGDATAELAQMIWLERAVTATLAWLGEQPDPGLAAREYERPGSPSWRAWLETGPWREDLRGPAIFRRRCNGCGELGVVDDGELGTCLACEAETEHGDVPF